MCAKNFVIIFPQHKNLSGESFAQVVCDCRANRWLFFEAKWKHGADLIWVYSRYVNPSFHELF